MNSFSENTSKNFSATRPERKRLADILPLDTPFTIYLDPCGACNFSCGFCPCNNADFRNQDRHKMMSMELFHKIVDDLSAFRQKIRVINLYCFGEPLLNKNIPAMARLLREREVCDEIMLVTNGSLLTPEYNRELASCGIDYIRISVEALSAEGYAVVSNKTLDFEKFLSNIRDLHYKCNTGGGYLRGQKRTQLHAKCINAMLKDEQDIERFHELFDDISDFVNVDRVEEGWWGDYESKIWKDSVKVISNVNYGGKICSRPFIHMVIHSNGEVSACCADWKFTTVYGDVNNEHLIDIWNSEKLRNFQLMHLENRRYENDFCAKCKLFCNDNIDEDAEVIAERLRKK